MKSIYLHIPGPCHAQCTQDVEDPVKIAEEVMLVKFVDNREDPVDVVNQVIEGTEDKEDEEVFNEVTKMICFLFHFLLISV